MRNALVCLLQAVHYPKPVVDAVVRLFEGRCDDLGEVVFVAHLVYQGLRAYDDLLLAAQAELLD
jgi:hypothetical protein